MATTEIRVPVRLEVLQDSISQIKSTLSSLKPESGAWKELQNILRMMSREADSLQVAMSKPFGNQSQFNAAEKGVMKIEDALERARIAMGRIKFSDIQLDAGQFAKIKQFESQLQEIEQKAKNFKATLKAELQGSEQWADFLEIDPNAVTHSYDQIVKEVEKRVNKLEQDSKKATEALRAAEEESSRIGASKQFFSAKKSLSREGMGEDFNTFFLTDKNGNTRFRSGEKAPFYEWMRSNLLITPQQYDEIKNKSVKDLQAWIKDFDIDAIINKTNTKKDQAKTQMADVAAQQAQARALQGVIAQNQSRIANSEATLGAETARVTGNLNNFQNSLTNSTRAALTSQSAISGVSGACSQLTYALQRTNAEWIRMDRTTQTLNSMRSSVVNFMGFYQVMNLVKKAVRDAAKHIQELDSVMNKISIVTDMSTGDLWNQIDSYSHMAQTYGVSIKGAYEVSQIYYQQGLETADVMTLTNETLKLAKISGLDYAQATDYMTTAIRGFKMEMQDAATVVDVYSALAANTAVSQEELAVAMSKTASSMEGVGASFEESSAMIATMVAVTRESATNIGSAMKSIASRYGELTKDPMTLIDADGEALAFNKVDTALQSVGISMKTADGQFRNFTDVILELSEVWNTLESTQQRYIATQFAGNRQQSRFLALVSNKDLLRANLDVAENSEDTGTVQALKALDSIESKTEQVKVAWQQFYTTVGAEDIWKGALGGLTTYINMLNGLPKLFGKIPIGAMAMIANLVDVIRNAGSLLLTGFSNVLEKIIQPDQVTSSIANAVREGVSQGFEIGAQTTQLTSVFENLGLKDVFQAELAKIDFSGEDVAGQLNTFYQNILAAAGNNQAQIQSAFSSLGQVGVAQAVGEGIASGTGEATFSASALGQAVLQALQTSINAHSPSPTIIALFRTGVGEAIEIGLQTSAAAVVAAAQQLGLSVSEALKSAAERGEKITLNDFFDEKQSLQMVDFIASKQVTQFSQRAKEASSKAEEARLRETANFGKYDIEYMDQTRRAQQYRAQQIQAQQVKDYTQAALSGKLFQNEQVGEDGLTAAQRDELARRRESLEQAYHREIDKRGYNYKLRDIYDEKLNNIYKDQVSYQSENAHIQSTEQRMRRELVEQNNRKWQSNAERIGPVLSSEYQATRADTPHGPMIDYTALIGKTPKTNEKTEMGSGSIYTDPAYASIFQNSDERQRKLAEEQRIIEENNRRREERQKQLEEENKKTAEVEEKQIKSTSVETINQETEALQQQAAAVNEVAAAKTAMEQAQSSNGASTNTEAIDQTTEALNRQKEAISGVKEAEEQKATAEQAQESGPVLQNDKYNIYDMQGNQQTSSSINELLTKLQNLGTIAEADKTKLQQLFDNASPAEFLSAYNKAIGQKDNTQWPTFSPLAPIPIQTNPSTTNESIEKLKQDMADIQNQSANQELSFKVTANNEVLDETKNKIEEIKNSASEEVKVTVTDDGTTQQIAENAKQATNAINELNNAQANQSATTTQPPISWEDAMEMEAEGYNEQNNTNLYSSEIDSVSALSDELVKLGGMSEEAGQKLKDSLYSASPEELTQKFQELQQSVELKTLQNDLSAAIDQLVQLGAMSEKASQQLKNSFKEASPDELKSKIEELNTKVQDTKLNQAFQRMDAADPEVAQINAQIAAEEQHQGVIQKTIDLIRQKSNESDAAGRKLNSIGSALSTVVSVIDKSTEGGRMFAGTLTTVAGGLKVVGALMQKNPWMALATGIVTVINGISMAYEDDLERAERLNKAAEEASNKAKEAKANQKDIEKTIKDFDTLKEKRYESEEGAQKYQEAVDNITNKFPSLIAGFDSAGEVILKAGEMEQILATAREQTAAATYKAAQAEKEKVENELAGKRKQLKNKVSPTDESFSEIDNKILTGDYTSTAVRTLLGYDELLGSNQNSEFINLYARLTNNIGAEGTLFAGAQETIPSIIANFGKVLQEDIEKNPALEEFKGTLTTNGYDSFNSFLSAVAINKVEDENLLSNFNEALKGLYKQYGFLNAEEFKNFLIAMPEDPTIDQDDNIKSILSAFENKQVESPILQDILTLATSYTDNSLSEEFLLSQLQPIKKAYEIFYNTMNDSNSSETEIYDAFTSYKKLLDEIQTTNPLYELLADRRQEAEEYASLIDDYGTLVAKDKVISKQLSNAYILKQFQTNASYSNVFDSAKGANGLVAAIGNQLALNYSSSNINTDFSSYADTRAAQDFMTQSLNGAETFLSTLNESTNTEKLKQFNQMMDNMSDYQWSDFETRFSTTDGWDTIKDLVQSEYQNQTGDISKRALNRIEQSKNAARSLGWRRLKHSQKNEQVFDTLDETSVLNSVLSTYDRLSNAGSTEEANNYIDGMSKILLDLNKIEDTDQRNAAFKALKGQNLNTREGVIAAGAALKQIEGLDAEFSNRLTQVGQKMLSNIPLALETLKDTVNTVWKDQGKEFDKLINGGIEGYEMQNVIDAASRVGVTLTVDDFSMTDSGKMLLNYEKWNTYYNAAMTQVNDQTKDLGEILANRAGDADSLTREMLQSAGIEVAKDDEDLEKYWDQYNEKMDEFAAQYAQVQMIPALMGRTLTRSQLKKGNFTSISKSLTKDTGESDWKRLLKLAGKEVKYSDSELKNADIKSTVKGIQGSVNSLISDIIKKGADNINLEDYDYLPKDGSLNLAGSLHKVVARYIKYAGLTIEEANNQIFAAFDKERSKTNTNLIRDLTFQGNRLVELTEDQFKNLVNTFEVDLSTEDGQKLVESFYNGINALTGKAAISLASLQSYGIDLSQVKGFEDIVEQSVASVFDTISGEVSNGVEYITQGAKNLSEVETFKQSYEQLTGTALADDAFGYNAITGTFTLGQQYLQEYLNAQKEKMKNMGYTEEFVNAYIKNLTDKAIQDNIELSAFLNATTTQSRNDEANKLIQQIRGLSKYTNLIDFETRMTWLTSQGYSQSDWDDVIRGNNEEIAQKYDLLILKTLESGGQAAVDLLKQIKPDASQEELEAAFNSQINKLNDVMSQVGDLVAGQFVGTEGKLYQVLNRVGAVDSSGVVQAGFDMVEVYAAIYAEMTKTAGNTTAGLNDVYAELMTAQDQSNINIIDALKNGNGMSYKAFGELLAQYDIKLKDYMEQSFGIVERDGFGNIRITDWEAFAKSIFKVEDLNAIKNTPEYISAFKAYNDGLIELNKNTEQAITDEIKQIENAKAGDWLNLTEFGTQYYNAFVKSTNIQDYLNKGFGQGLAAGMADLAKKDNAKIFNNLNSQLNQWGANFEDGILKIGENANLLGIAQTLEQAAIDAGLEIGNGLEEVKDAIKNVLSSYTEAITKGIEGGLSNTEKSDLIKKADNLGISNLHFQQTAEGLKLSQQSAIELYQALSRVDALQGKIVFDKLAESLKESNEHFATTPALLNRIAYLTKIINGMRDNTLAADERVSEARLNQYKAELEVAKEIAAVRSATEDESFNFMDNKIPAGQNNPLNYAKNWTKAINAIKDAYKVKNTRDLKAGGVQRTRTGYMGYEDFYNVINEINNMAGIMNTPIKIGKDIRGKSIELNGSLTAASDAILAGIETMGAVNTGEMMVNIGKLGINLAKGGSELEGNIDKGIDAVADAQIKALDGMIAMLELIVAMEELGDIAGEDMVIELPDIVTDNPDFDKNMDGLSDNFEAWRAKFLKAGSKSRELAESITINGQNMVDWLDRAAAEWTEDDAAILNALYQAAISTDWNLNDIGGSLQQMLNSGKFGELAEGFTITLDDVVYTISHGVVVEVADFSNKEAQEVLKQYQIKSGEKDSKKARQQVAELVQKYLNGEGATTELPVTEIIKLRNNTLIKTDNKGNDYIELTGADGNVHQYDSTTPQFKAAVQEQILKDQGIDPKDITTNYDAGTAVATTTYGIKAETKFEVTADENGEVTWKLNKDDPLYKYGKNFHGNSREELLRQIYQNLKGAAELGHDSEAAKLLDGSNSFESFIYLHYGIHLKVQTEVYKDGQQITDPSKDPKFRKDAKDLVQEIKDKGVEAIEEISSDGEGKTTIKTKNGYEIKLDTDDISYDGKNIDKDLLTEKLNEIIGIDGSLKDTISSAITEALKSLPELIKSLNETDTQGIEKVATAIGKIYTEANNAYEKLTQLVEEIAKLAESLSKEMELKIKVPEKPEKGSNPEDGTSDDGVGAGTGTGEGTVGPQTVDVVANITSIIPDPVEVTVNASEVKVPENTTVPVKAEVEPTSFNPPDNLTASYTAEVTGDKPQSITDLQAKWTGSITGDIPQSMTLDAIWKGQKGDGFFPGNMTATVTWEGKKGKGFFPSIGGKGPAIGTFGLGDGTMATLGMAHAKGTLMGELGPELVVSNGRYFVAGQNGAEMVNLADDAIVFNHLQTEQLLKNGMSKERGRAVTNERNAVAFATGNVNGGPAMASASAALAALKQLRAMWVSLRNASVSDLAGAGGGGGGGGGEKSKVVDPKAWVDTVERWFNLMQDIAQLEYEITYQEKIRTKISSDWQKNGKAYYESQTRSLKALKDQIAAQEQLNLSRQEYFDKRIEALKDEPLGQIYSWDPNTGKMNFNPGQMEWLTDLVGFDNNKGANYTNKEKYDILMARGFANYMKYDSNGMEIKADSDNDGTISEEEQESFYENATKAFWDKVDEFKESTESLHESIQEGNEKLEELETNRNELLKEITDNQLAVEDAVLNAIEESRQREIDNLQEQRDKLEESVGKYIDGLSEALEKEQKMYEDQDAQNELNRNRRRLAILQRAGGSVSDINSLQAEIRDQERDMYYNAQQAQIDAIQEASDLELERLDNQIDIMTQQLEYQKEFGLLWNDVYEVMNRSSEFITSFIAGNTESFWESSPLKHAEQINDTLFQAEQWLGYRTTSEQEAKDIALIAQETKRQMHERDFTTYNEAMIKEFGADYDSSGRYAGIFNSVYAETASLSEASEAARRAYHDEVIAPREAARRAAEAAAAAAAAEAAVQAASSGSGGGGGGSSSSQSGSNTRQGRVIPTIGVTSRDNDVINARDQLLNSISQTGLSSQSTQAATERLNTALERRRTSGGCFIAGTKIIMADYSLKNIENVKLNEYVIAYDEIHNEFVSKRIIKAYPHYNTPRVLDILLSNGIHLGITPGHPLLTIEGWKSRDPENSLYEHNTVATWLNIGDQIIGYNKNVRVLSIKEMIIPDNYTTYNLEVEDCHTYLAEGLVVHNAKTNKARGGYVGHGIYELGEQGTETVLTASQTQILRNNILSNRPSSLISLLKTYNEGFSRMDTPLTGAITEDNSTNIDKLEFSMNVQQISNDYDARRAGEQAMNEIMRIARKTSAANSIRR